MRRLVGVPGARGLVRLVLVVLLVPGGAGGTAAAQDEDGPCESSARAGAVRDLLQQFDAAWADGDLERLTAPLSPSFGCELYGDVDASQLRDAYGLLLDDLKGTRCSTHVLQVRQEGEVLQAYTCRFFAPSDAPDDPIEELCHVYYLKDGQDGLAIVGLEEYDHDGYACVRPDRFEQRRLAFSFERPEGTFVVPVPDAGAALEEVVLRGDGLRFELRVIVLACEEPLRLEEAFDADLRDWLRANRPAKVERRGPTEVAGRPAWEAVARFSAPSCQLSGAARNDEPKRARRVYAALDEHHLLALTLHAPRSRFAVADRALQRVLDSFRLDLDEGAAYGETIARRNGWGRLEGGFFACADSGLMVEAPEGFELEVTRTGALLSLRAVPPAGNVSFRIDCMPLLDPAVPLEELIDLDDATRETVRRSRLPLQVGDHHAVQVDRDLPAGSPAEERMEKIVYVRSGRHVVTIRVAGTPEEVGAAQSALDELLKGISLVGR